MPAPDKKVYDLNEARIKISRYCAYQERSHKQVRNKLFEMGLKSEAVDLLTAECIEGNFLNEERFARSFARGKHRIKGWGRERIKRELKRHDVSEYCIRAAMEEISEEDYQSAFRDIAEKKWLDIEGENRFVKGRKLSDFLLRKGYEKNQVLDWVHARINEDSA